MATKPATVEELIGLWPSPSDFARDIGITANHAQVILVRGSISPEQWPKVLVAAQRRKLRITTDDLLKIRLRGPTPRKAKKKKERAA
jgi:hypothetical protein